jgi:hypothetical protein
VVPLNSYTPRERRVTGRLGVSVGTTPTWMPGREMHVEAYSRVEDDSHDGGQKAVKKKRTAGKDRYFLMKSL